jgi:hypothetical protein
MKSPHEFQRAVVTEIPIVKAVIEHDDFIEGLSIPAKLAQVIDLNRNVVSLSDYRDSKDAA